jgi:hypothetical protein
MSESHIFKSIPPRLAPTGVSTAVGVSNRRWQPRLKQPSTIGTTWLYKWAHLGRPPNHIAVAGTGGRRGCYKMVIGPLPPHPFLLSHSWLLWTIYASNQVFCTLLLVNLEILKNSWIIENSLQILENNLEILKISLEIHCLFVRTRCSRPTAAPSPMFVHTRSRRPSNGHCTPSLCQL